MYTDPSGHQAWDGCSGENGGCAGGSNYKDYVYNYLHTDQERQENQEDLEKAVDTVTTVIGVVNEPADWMMTAAYCAAGECSPWVLVGLLPFIPGSAGRKLDEVIALLPAPKIQKHHIFPQQFKPDFDRVGINIDKHTVELSEGVHLKGVHGKGGFVGPGNKMLPTDKWNEAWSYFFNTNNNPTAKEIYQFAGKLIDEYGLSGLPIVPYK